MCSHPVNPPHNYNILTTHKRRMREERQKPSEEKRGWKDLKDII